MGNHGPCFVSPGKYIYGLVAFASLSYNFQMSSVMIDLILTALIPVAMVAMFLVGMRTDVSQPVLGKELTQVLKGLCSIVVILVHIPRQEQNPLQDAIGSFAYVAVTFFFLFSAYGMSLSAKENPNYLRYFWRGRLAALLIPCLVINIFGSIWMFATKGTVTVYSLLGINRYVVILLEYCLAFYAVERIRMRWSIVTETAAASVLILLVTVSSLYTYSMFSEADNSGQVGWPFERMGLVWGLLLYMFAHDISLWMRTRRHWKIALLIVACLILGTAYLKFKHVEFVGEYVLKILLGLSIVTSVLTVCQMRRLGNRVTNFLGSISFEIYLSHGLVVNMLIFCCPELESGIFIICAVIGTVAVSWAAHLLSKPCVAFIRNGRSRLWMSLCGR